jgi:hypothetical protein
MIIATIDLSDQDTTWTTEYPRSGRVFGLVKPTEATVQFSPETTGDVLAIVRVKGKVLRADGQPSNSRTYEVTIWNNETLRKVAIKRAVRELKELAQMEDLT